MLVSPIADLALTVLDMASTPNFETDPCFSLLVITYSGCDTRNAVIVVNSLGVAFYTLMVISFSLLYGDTIDYDDDQVQGVMDRLDNTKTGITLATFIVGLVCTSAALYGGVKFNKAAISIGALWYLLEALRGIFVFDPIAMGIAIGFSYPHAVFYHELKSGVMSPQNYEKEKVCCDCCCTC